MTRTTAFVVFYATVMYTLGIPRRPEAEQYKWWIGAAILWSLVAVQTYNVYLDWKAKRRGNRR